MCDPILGTIISFGATILGGASQFFGQQQQASALEQSAAFNAAVIRNNQIRADQLAVDARLRGNQAEAQKRRDTQRLIGRQRAVLAGNGVEINSGSAASIQADSARFGELDALTIRNNAEREAAGFRFQASQFGAQANLTQFTGGQQAQAIRGESVGTLLSTAGSVASKWFQFSNAGAFSGSSSAGGASGAGGFSGGGGGF